jgi:TonB family protein
VKQFLAAVSLVGVVSQAAIAAGDADGALAVYADPVPIAWRVPLAECFGYVELSVVLSAEGGVAQAGILESFPRDKFDQLVLASVPGWRFKNFDVHEPERPRAVRLRVEFRPSGGMCRGSSISSTGPIEVNEGREPSPACLGVVIQELTPEIIAHLAVTRPQVARLALDRPQGGVMVSRVLDGSPADEAGLRRTDILERLNSHRVDHHDDIPFLLARMRPGEGFEIIAFRSGAYITLAGAMGALVPDGGCRPMSDRNTPP